MRIECYSKLEAPIPGRHSQMCCYPLANFSISPIVVANIFEMMLDADQVDPLSLIRAENDDDDIDDEEGEEAMQ